MITSENLIEERPSEKGNLYPNTDSKIWLRSCEKEIITPLHGIKTGVIPKWINGALLRNGPGSVKVGDMEFKHLFDCSAFLHRFAIKDGEVTYQCRFLQTSTYKKNHLANRIVVTEFGTKAVADPCHSIFDKVTALFKPGESYSDNAMISVYPFGDEIYTFTESPIVHRIDPETLETKDRINFSEHFNVLNHTSHPHVEENGDVYNVGMSVTPKGINYSVYHFAHTTNGRMYETAKRVANVPTRWPLHPGYMHTFGLTENYFIIVEQPLSVSISKYVKLQFKNCPMNASLKWFPDYDTLFHVVTRKTGKIVKTFHAEGFFYLHIINQYEENDHIVIDICCYKDAAMLDLMYLDSIRNMQSNPDYAKLFRGRPMRFVLPLKGDMVTLGNTKATSYNQSNDIYVIPELLYTVGCETPRINYDKYLGKPYRFFYAIGSDVDTENPGSLFKIDTYNKTACSWYEENCYPSEPIFVPSPNSQGEDDGIILSAMVWGKNRNSEVGLLVLCAKTMAELGRVTFNTPSPAPKCLHGWFLPNKNNV